MLNKTHYLLFFLVCSWALRSQTKTISEKKTNEREVKNTHKVMLIPFEPRLYLSEIDYKINQETKLSTKEIKHKFRDGLNEQLFKAFKAAQYGALDLMEDTAKYKKDINGIYQYLTYDYMKVPDQKNYQPPKKEKDDKKIDKGQLVVETNSDQRFMNARITEAKVVPLLYGKYKTDVFVFINQLDIHGSTSKDPNNPGIGNGKRRITVHYTVYTLDAREINSGIAEEEFDAELNNPKKIIDKHFYVIAQTIVQRVNKGLGITNK